MLKDLIPANVTILDQFGKLLNDTPAEGDSAGADLTRLQYQRDVEGAYAKRIETMLSEVLGVGSAVARVTADLDYSSFEKEEESFDPAGIEREANVRFRKGRVQLRPAVCRVYYQIYQISQGF